MMAMFVSLFPLPNLVLFPGVELPLYVFEPRYRALLADVQASGEPFGIVQILKSSAQSPLPFHERVSRVGTLAHLQRAQQHEDGTSTISVVGGERFQVRDFQLDRPYLSAHVDLWPLAADPLGQQAEQANASKLLASLLRLRPQDAQAIRLHAPSEPLLLASFAASLLTLSPQQKEAALRTPTLLDRLHELLSNVPLSARTLN